ncbi:agamous-like MADS-box protein AGL14 isoform X1 [Senna tora]|uniref:Agamous-like MADS-box protein AGL14 isoform X1 n=1 Tax=Senna tora TaxID=362788 RepID=A0A834WP87_9FABA|nr:agamous-like MADS-box protein AGL14 isoform X1 [Senna tora]
MVRGKTEMKRIENDTSRQVTFSKRRNGLLKKAFELSVLCEAEVALIIFSPTGKLSEFSSSRCFSINKTVERYQRKVKDLSLSIKGIQQNRQHLKEGSSSSMAKKIEQLEVSKRKLLGDDLDTCSIEELRELENQLERSLNKIRARKCCGEEQEWRYLSKEKDVPVLKEMRDDVETELVIGPPERVRRMP